MVQQSGTVGCSPLKVFALRNGDRAKQPRTRPSKICCVRTIAQIPDARAQRSTCRERLGKVSVTAGSHCRAMIFEIVACADENDATAPRGERTISIESL